MARLIVEISMTHSQNKKLEQERADSNNSASEVSTQISNKLQALYKSVEEQTIPDRFLDLLEQLDTAESKHTKGGHQ